MGKKKKGADKEKKAKKKPAVNEKDIVFYEQQILDNNRQLSRLRTRNEFLEGELDLLKGQLVRLESDRSDVIAHLKKILQQKTEESKELGERLVAMEELGKEEKLLFKTKEETMLQEFHNMETNLNAEVKLVSGKLNALEDWRNSRAELTRKFEIQEKEMAEQEERHKKSWYEAEKSLVIGKAQMQREMQEHLNELSWNFQRATNLRMADATQRAIRENIALNSELDSMYKSYQELQEKVQSFKETEESTRLRALLLQEEAQIVLNKMIEQNKFITKIAKDHLDAAWLLTDQQRIQNSLINKNKMIQILETKYENTNLQAEEIQKLILNANINENNFSQDIKVHDVQIKQLRNIFDSVKNFVTKLLEQVQSENTNSMKITDDPNFIKELMEIYKILENQDILNIIISQKE